MQLLLLTHRPRRHTARRLEQAAVALGHTLAAVDPSALWVTADGVWDARGRRVPSGAVWWRPGGVARGHALGIVEALERRGAACWASPAALGALFPAWRALTAAAAAGLPVARFAAVANARQASRASAKLGPGPKVLTAYRAQGERLMVRTGAAAAATAAAQVLWRDGATGEVALAGPRRRLLVVATAVVAAVETRDGRLAPHRASKAEMELAAAASRVLALPVLGLDLAGTSAAPQLAGVSPAPALEGAEAACGLDLARPMVEAWVAWTGQGWTGQGRTGQG